MKHLWLRPLILLASLFVTHSASAAIDKSGVLDTVADRFMTESATWGAIITGYASWLFWLLVTISMIWTFGMMALRKADIQEFFAELVRFTIFTGFYWWLLINGPSFAMDIINSLRDIGAAAGATRTLTPSAPIDIAFDIIDKAGNSYSVLSPIDNLAIFFTTLAILACMGVIAANVLLSLVAAWVVAYAGVFVLGFGGSRWTSDIAINYYRAVTGIALKLMTMTLLIGVAVSVIDGFHDDLQNGAPMRELLVVFVVSLVLLVLVHSIPNIVAGLIPGGGAPASAGSSFSAGALGGAALGAAGMAAATAATAGAALGAVATSAGGGVSALMAAFSKATESGSSSSDVIPTDVGSGKASSNVAESSSSTPLAEAAGFGGSDSKNSHDSTDENTSGASNGGEDKPSAGGDFAGNGEHAGSNDRAPGSTGPGMLSSAGTALGKAGRIAADTSVHLARGMGQVATTKASSVRSAVMDRIADTTGGRIAAAIRSQGDSSSIPGPTFGSNSLSSGFNDRVDATSEVTAFANRSNRSSS